MKTILKANNIEKVFGEKENTFYALKNIDLEVNEGEFVAIMGPSGAGKTTLLNILSTIDTPTSGTITVDGKEIMGLDEKHLSRFRRDELGFIFQDYNLLDTLTVKENIVLPLALAKTPVEEIDRRVDEIAETFGINGILKQYPYQISGGQKQRTAAARAIITNPSLVLADEPTGALDSKSAKQLLESLTALNEKKKATILMVTHDAYAASYCDRIVFIRDGEMNKAIYKEDTREAFYQEVLDELATFGGE